MKNTLIVNLYAGPGAGKSTAAAYIFSRLKMLGIDAELVTEYAKDKTWEACHEVFNNELYINAKQCYRISRVYGKVDVIVTDSPILIGCAYTNEEHVKHASICEDAKYTNRIDCVINRNTNIEYNENGRNQTLAESIEIDNDILAMLEALGINTISIEPNIECYDKLVDRIKNIVLQ